MFRFGAGVTEDENQQSSADFFFCSLVTKGDFRIFPGKENFHISMLPRSAENLGKVVNLDVCAFRIVVGQGKPFDLRFFGNLNGILHRGVSPACLAVFIFICSILGIMEEQIRSLDKFL